MRPPKTHTRTADRGLPKAATGIPGLDEVTGGGLPRGRPTLVCGSAGCGKTLFATDCRGSTRCSAGRGTTGGARSS